MPTHRTGSWKKAKPAGGGSTKLTPEIIAWAQARAKQAGRRYPNLIDNMAASRRQRESASGGEHP